MSDVRLTIVNLTLACFFLIGSQNFDNDQLDAINYFKFCAFVTNFVAAFMCVQAYVEVAFKQIYSFSKAKVESYFSPQEGGSSIQLFETYAAQIWVAVGKVMPYAFEVTKNIAFACSVIVWTLLHSSYAFRSYTLLSLVIIILSIKEAVIQEVEMQKHKNE